MAEKSCGLGVGDWVSDGFYWTGIKEDGDSEEKGVKNRFGWTFSMLIPGVLSFAIFIIGCLGAGGVMTTGAMTGAVAITGAAAITCHIINGGFCLPSTWIALARFVTVIALGSIAMTTNMLSGVQLGYGLFSTMLTSSFVLVIVRFGVDGRVLDSRA